MQRKRQPHLPDCAMVQSAWKIGVMCDCGMPRHPLPGHLELYRDAKGKLKTRRRTRPFWETMKETK